MLVPNDPSAHLKPRPDARFRFRLPHHDDPSPRHFMLMFERWDAKWKIAGDIDPNRERDHHKIA